MKRPILHCSKRRAFIPNAMITLTFVIIGVFYANEVYAGRITMSNPQEETTEDGKRVCIYSNSIYTFTTVTKSLHCPVSKTFDTEDAE